MADRAVCDSVLEGQVVRAVTFWSMSVAVLMIATSTWWNEWMARRHLWEVWQKATSRTSPVDDSRELLSYRTATIGLMVSLFFITAWGSSYTIRESHFLLGFYLLRP